MADLVLLVGFKNSGKNTAAAALVDIGFVTMSFGDALKDMLTAVFGWDRRMLEGDTVASRVFRETVDPWWASRLRIDNFSPRMALELIGTEVMRDHLDPDIWVLAIERRIANLRACQPGQKIVLVDGRFPNEIALARRLNGIVVRIKRGPDPEWFEIARKVNAGIVVPTIELSLIHRSERAWIGCEIDHCIENNSTADDLHQRMRGIIF